MQNSNLVLPSSIMMNEPGEDIIVAFKSGAPGVAKKRIFVNNWGDLTPEFLAFEKCRRGLAVVPHGFRCRTKFREEWIQFTVTVKNFSQLYICKVLTLPGLVSTPVDNPTGALHELFTKHRDWMHLTDSAALLVGVTYDIPQEIIIRKCAPQIIQAAEMQRQLPKFEHPSMMSMLLALIRKVCVLVPECERTATIVVHNIAHQPGVDPSLAERLSIRVLQPNDAALADRLARVIEPDGGGEEDESE